MRTVERQFQILADGGYFGNIAALMFAYQTNASSVRQAIRNNLASAKTACFTRRPSQVFTGSQVRTGVVTARKTEDGGNEPIETSKFLRFTDDDRKETVADIEYAPTGGLILGDEIGDGKDKSLPKIGESELRDVLEKLKNASDTVVRDVSSRNSSEETEHAVWRSRHPAYFVNPCLENLYDEGDTPQDFDPFYFESESERRTAFLALQSSLFYAY